MLQKSLTPKQIFNERNRNILKLAHTERGFLMKTFLAILSAAVPESVTAAELK